MMKQRKFGIAVCIFIICTAYGDVLDIGEKRQIFVDDYIIERLGNAFLKMHKPVDRGMAVKLFDSPCEDKYCCYATVLKDERGFHLYYRGIYSTSYTGLGAYCYASSADGINWVKPALGIYEYKGGRDNNIILLGAEGTQSFCPFIDTNPQAAVQQKFKALGLKRTEDELGWVLLAFASPDGINWQKLQDAPVMTDGSFNTQNVSFWSESENQYVCYYKGATAMMRAVSDDFITWSSGEVMTYSHNGAAAAAENIYIHQTSPYFRARDVYIATAGRFMGGRRAVTDEQASSPEAQSLGSPNFAGCSDAVLMSSRGANEYRRTFMEGWIRPDIGLENWSAKTNAAAVNIVQTGQTEMSVYMIEGYGLNTSRLQRYSMRLDGLVSLHAPYTGGEFITKTFRCVGGALTINYSTSAAGGIQVEVQDGFGRPADGYAIDDCPVIIGDHISRVVVWQNNTMLNSLEGSDIRLRFVFNDADLYSFKFEKCVNPISQEQGDINQDCAVDINDISVIMDNWLLNSLFP